MGNSLADYKIEKSSSSDINNIKWTQKNPVEHDKPKKKKTTRNTSPLNIIYASKTKKIKPSMKKLIKIEEIDSTNSKDKKKTGKRFQKSSADNCLIKPGFTRPGR